MPAFQKWSHELQRLVVLLSGLYLFIFLGMTDGADCVSSGFSSNLGNTMSRMLQGAKSTLQLAVQVLGVTMADVEQSSS